MYRQGDILIVPATEIPPHSRRLDHCVIALGEATGHQHRIAEGAEQWRTAEGEQFVRVTGPAARLVHEEHGTITLPGPGIYRVIHQREYEPAAALSHVPVLD